MVVVELGSMTEIKDQYSKYFILLDRVLLKFSLTSCKPTLVLTTELSPQVMLTSRTLVTIGINTITEHSMTLFGSKLAILALGSWSSHGDHCPVLAVNILRGGEEV